MTRRLLLGAGVLVPLAGRNWEREAFPEWSEGQVDKVLTDSPWARPLTLPFRFSAPAPGIEDRPAPPAQTEIYLTMRWATALPVRQAMALHQYGRLGLGSAGAMALLRGSEKEYVLEIAGFPAGMVPQGVRRFEAQLMESAILLVKGRKALRATSASVPEYGNHLISTLRFARFENLSDGEGFIEFSAQAGPMDIHQKYKLRDMNYKGRLEL